MLNYYATAENRIQSIEKIAEGCWINMVSPSEKEIDCVHHMLNVDLGFLKAALDDEETSRIEIEDNNQILIIIDIPLAQKDQEALIFSTIPLGIIITEKNIITVCLKENSIIREFADGIVKNVYTHMKTRFILQLFFRVAVRYLQYLKQIDKISSEVEKQLHQSMKNKELIQLLDLQKSLVYFSTSLKANESTMQKIVRNRTIKMYEEDQDLLEDVLIENKQAIEMSNIYTSILSGTMDAFASVISNNLNIVMKFLTSITIVLSLPTMVASFYGMNVKIPLQDSPFAFIFTIVLALVLTTMATFMLIKRKMF
ncbi:MAG: magnesium transporter CorA family protein [Clostridia bacterium]